MDNVVIIDSGLGGLTIFNHLLELNCNTNVTYLADNRYFPYGTKSDQELKIIIERILTHFIAQGYEHLFLACNTASVIYSKYFLNHFNTNIYPIVDNTVNELHRFNCKRVGVIGTDKTIQEEAYQNKIKELADVEVIAYPCSELVTLCEEYDEEKIKAYIKTHFTTFKENKIDTLLLGCTHFNMIKNLLEDYFQYTVNIIRSGYGLIESLCQKDTKKSQETSIHKLYITKKDDLYSHKIKLLFPNLNNQPVEWVSI